MEILIATKGRTPCGRSCPYYQESGEVACIGGPKKTHCRLIMQPFWLDCNQYDVRTLRRLTVSERQLEKMQTAIGRKAKKVRKPWRTDHKPTNAIGGHQNLLSNLGKK